MALAMPMASAIEKAGVWSDSDIAAPKGGVLPQAIARRGAYCRRQ